MNLRQRSSANAGIFSSTAKLAATFTATAATDLITSNSHGLSNGDCLQFTTTGTLPAGLSLATNYYVKNATTNTFQVSADNTGAQAIVDIADTGSGTHTFNVKGKIIQVKDGLNKTIQIATASSAAFNIKVQGSESDTCPDFNAASSATNTWTYVQTIDLNDATPYDGDVGITFAGTDAQYRLAVNDDTLKWITIIVSSWTAGTLGASLTQYFE